MTEMCAPSRYSRVIVSETKSPQGDGAMRGVAMDAIAGTHHAGLRMRTLMSRAAQLVMEHGAHPVRTVVLLPFRNLLPLAREAWASTVPDGFAPRFETTQTWTAAAVFTPGAEDFSGDIARDLLAARSLLERAGFSEHADLLAARLVEATRQVAAVACAVAPEDRRAWAARMRQAMRASFEAPVLSHESAIASVAIEWAAASAYASDRLLEPSTARDADLLVVVQGLREEPLAEAVAARFAGPVERLRLLADAPMGAVAFHVADDPADEAERAAACVLHHVREGRTPVALAAIDRVLTRRIRAILEQAGAAIRDETGWTLSTTRFSAHVMLALRACSWNAGADAVIDWLKNSPAHSPGSVLALERRMRRAGIREWRSLRADDLGEGQQALLQLVNEWRDGMQAPRALPLWLESLRALLRASGQWPRLELDPAGLQVLAALRLGDIDRAELEGFAPARSRMVLAEFVAWVQAALEASNFIPPAPADAQVTILSFQLLAGRPFPAVVMPGCDESRLPVAADPPGSWTPSQRETLGLPSREQLGAETREAWRVALQAPHCDVLWRRSDETGEDVVPSVLVQQLLADGVAREGADAREVRTIGMQPTQRPLPVGARLPVDRISASAYEDLRRCPYRFFALRQLSLQEPDEIDVDLDKRDFGNWLHRVLGAFHTTLAASGTSDRSQREAMLDDAARTVEREMRLDEGEFLPFRASWPQVRRGYLDWLGKHEAGEGATFVEAESEHERRLGALTLFGRIDRIDRLANGTRMVMDYKTESPEATQKRAKQPGEDTQLAFYAALLDDTGLRAAYVNVGERGETKTVEQKDIGEVREMLEAAIGDELGRIAGGAALPALGEGAACGFCAARGLCRKDFWP